MSAVLRNRSGVIHAPPGPGKVDRNGDPVSTLCGCRWYANLEPVPGPPYLVELEAPRVTCGRCLKQLERDRLRQYWLSHATLGVDGLWMIRLENGSPALTLSAGDARELARRLLV